MGDYIMQSSFFSIASHLRLARNADLVKFKSANLREKTPLDQLIARMANGRNALLPPAGWDSREIALSNCMFCREGSA
jgi:hypothetical protein